MLYLSRITDATVDAFASRGFNARIRKHAQCGPRLNANSTTCRVIIVGLKADINNCLFFVNSYTN